MSIVEKRKTELLITKSIIMLIPKLKDKLDEYHIYKTEIERLKNIENQNIKLALKLNELNDKYIESKNQNNQLIKLNIEYNNIVKLLNFKIHCPSLKKDIMFHNCIDASNNKICKHNLTCETKLNEIIKNFGLLIKD